MNTSTMVNQHHRGVAPNKRKDRDYQKPSKFIKPSQLQRVTVNISSNKQESSASNTQLLAGYMAYEFLNKGTLLGEPWEPTGKPRRLVDASKMERDEKYVDHLTKDDGVQIPGVFNPTQMNPVLQL